MAYIYPDYRKNETARLVGRQCFDCGDQETITLIRNLREAHADEIDYYLLGVIMGKRIERKKRRNRK